MAILYMDGFEHYPLVAQDLCLADGPVQTVTGYVVTCSCGEELQRGEGCVALLPPDALLTRGNPHFGHTCSLTWIRE